ncbi:MAG: phosphopyruvate hydratase, partial [Candidatus Diapherotrites archaeon]|nr:phosphopyruvate hydratase [Candidatus Diapherotrites archaeon]
MPSIQKIFARQVFDSRGYPTVEAEVHTENGFFSSIVPSGTSAGKHEALELRDGGAEYFGKGVKQAVANVNTKIAKALFGKDPFFQKEIDQEMIELDGTQNKSALGANAILAISMACCRAGAAAKKKELFEHIAGLAESKKISLPWPMMVAVSGGAHADKSTDLQEFMIMPSGAKNFNEGMRFGVETYHALEGILKKKGMHTNVGKEGSFAPTIKSNEEALELIVKAIEEAGYSAGKDVSITIDAAATEFFDGRNYFLKSEGKKLSGQELADYYG